MEQWLMSPQEASDLTYVESEAVKTSVKVFEEAISNEVLDSMPVAQANMLRVTYAVQELQRGPRAARGGCELAGALL